MILISFMAASAALTLVLAFTLYSLTARRMRIMTAESSRQLLEQTTVNLEDYLLNMRRISDAMYYDVIKDKDLAEDTVDTEMNLIYETHRDNLVSFALYDAGGSLISAAPISAQKKDVDVTGQDWFTAASSQVENLHFSTPHVQNLFDDPAMRYNWVISLSRTVELNQGGRPGQGVLLVDMNYAAVEQILDKINDTADEQYIYLTDRKGQLIYHPRMMQIASGLFTEPVSSTDIQSDGIHEDSASRSTVIVSTVSYTGWKLISVIPDSAFHLGMINMRYFALMLVSISLLVMLLLYRLISLGITRPLIRLNNSVSAMMPSSDGSELYIGGTDEVRHLGVTLRSAIGRNHQLMRDIVQEQEEKRKSELDALQSQINPHFLYNTLDSIVWMIEAGSNREAVFMVTELASLFRISLSRGRNIIPLSQEIRHARNYMNIQKVRYKNTFSLHWDIDPAIECYCTVKLILQPLLENAIYYGVEGLDDEGEITVRGKMEAGNILLQVIDNGYGMTAETVALLLRDDPESRQRAPRHGSGVGLFNVHRRISLRFGDAYGLSIDSAPDEGTCVNILLPAIPYNEANQQALEAGRRLTPDTDNQEVDAANEG